MTGARHPCTETLLAESRYKEALGQLLSGLLPTRLLSAISLTVLFLASQSFAGQTASSSSNKASEGTLTLTMLTTARRVHNLSSEEAARGHPVRLRGTVTFFDRFAKYNLVALFLQDATGSVYVSGVSADLPVAAGTIVEVEGISDPGGFAPIVDRARIRFIGVSHLPPVPTRVSLTRLRSGSDDGAWVEVEGVIRSIQSVLDHYIDLELSTTDGIITSRTVAEPGVDYSGLIDATVRISANVSPLYNTRHQVIGAHLVSPNFAAIKVVHPAPGDAFQSPRVNIGDLFHFRQGQTQHHRVHLRGAVTLQWPGSLLCVTDRTGGICAQTTESTSMPVGAEIDLIGFATMTDNGPVLANALFRNAGDNQPVSPRVITADQVLAGEFDSTLVQIDGTLMGRDLTALQTTLLFSSGSAIFSAILPKALTGPEIGQLRFGSKVRLTGICSVQSDQEKTAHGGGIQVSKRFQVLMRAPSDIVVLQRASWWTRARALAVLTIALAAAMLALGWVAALRKRVKQQTSLLNYQAGLLRASEESFRFMAQHDALTGLANRLLLEDRLHVALEAAKRSRTGLTLMMLDLDEFKQINDGLGHHAGDEVLRISSNRLVAIFRSSDTIARLGGDEFVALLPDMSDPKVAAIFAARAVAALSLPIPFEGSDLHISVSVGVCMASSGQLEADALMKAADAALYRAKARGRNCFEIQYYGSAAA